MPSGPITPLAMSFLTKSVRFPAMTPNLDGTMV